jgi:peptide/nickel transport system permease protein
VARFILGKIARLVVVLLLVSFGLTFLIDLTPGDPAQTILGVEATPEQVQLLHEQLHLDDPILSRYWRWLEGVLQFDFGNAYLQSRPVFDIISERLPTTIELMVLTLIVALAVSVPIGIYTAYRAGGRFDRFWMTASSAMVSVPSFVGALIFVYVFAILLKDAPIHFPATGWTELGDGVADNLWHLVLPVLTLAIIPIPSFSRLLRADMIATLQSDYILAARARGVPTLRILLRHALRPSSFSLLTVVALQLGHLIGGAVIVEVLFALPGLGSLVIQAINVKDIPIVQGIVMFVAIVYVVINAALDIFYAVLDPRIRSWRA